MTPAARISAAIDVLASIETDRRPAGDVLRDWGRANRFAGAKDRAALASLVYDSLRKRASSGWLMGEDTPRARALGALRQSRGLPLADVEALFSGARFAPAPLSEDEKRRYAEADLVGAPAHVAGDFPEWLAPFFLRAFGADAVAEAQALAARAPFDLRVNALRSGREKALAALAHLHPQEMPHAALGLRLPTGADGRGPALAAEPAYVKGLVEIQDEGSQIAALFARARPGEQVLDLCAGGGGKTLALAAAMDNRGQIYAADADGRRLMPIFERLERAGVRNAQVRAPKGAQDVLADLAQRCDLVLVDAPCTGVGAWRRNPDAKWRMRPGALEQRMKDQDEALARAAGCVKPGGRLVYITCSLLREENEDRVAAFCAAHRAFVVADMDAIRKSAGLENLPVRKGENGLGLTLTPATSGTDGFYVCVLTKTA